MNITRDKLFAKLRNFKIIVIVPVLLTVQLAVFACDTLTKRAELDVAKISAIGCRDSKNTNNTNQRIIYAQQLFDAALTGEVDDVKFLIKNRIDVNKKDSNGRTALMHACGGLILEPTQNKTARADTLRVIRQRKETICSLLINANCDVNLTDTSGSTALHDAVIWCNLRICSMLLKNGSSVNAQDNYGNTALHFAVRDKCNDALIKTIIEAGADTAREDIHGKTAFQYLTKNGKSK